MTTLTILTPVYNRKARIKDLFKSLTRQTNNDFQWLVIDDGSNDGTSSWFADLSLEKEKFHVDYYYKENGGKHTALNFSHPYIKGKYVVVVDSDDILIPTAVDEIIKYWNKYQNKSLRIGSIIFQKGDRKNGKAFDKTIHGEYVTTISKEINRGIEGDHCETFRSELFKSHQFPVYKGERFAAEGAMWYKITQGWHVMYVDKVIYLAEYLKGGLTLSGRKLRIRNPQGSRWHAKIFLQPSFNLKIRFKNALLFDTYSHFIDDRLSKVISNFEVSSRGLLILCWLPSLIIYKYWKFKYEN